MPTLAASLAALHAEKLANRDPALTAVLERSTEALKASGIADQALGVGVEAPPFSRPDVDGRTLRSSVLAKRGPIILSFFRGRW